MSARHRPHVSIALCAAAALATGGCAGPFAPYNDQYLREQVMRQHRAYLNAAAGGVQELSRPVSSVEKDLENIPGRRQELDKMSGPASYDEATIRQQMKDLGVDLLGKDLFGSKDTPILAVSLRRALRMSVQTNLDIQLARVIPAISQTQVTQAEAVFDAVFFTNFDFQKLDTVQPPTSSDLLAQFGIGSTQSDTRTLTTGLRKVLSTGGQITAQTALGRNFRDPTAFVDGNGAPLNHYNSADFLFSIQQPLLRNFGADIVRAQIMLSRNARLEAVQDLRQRMLQALQRTEEAYWQLVLARQQLMIQARLLQRTTDDFVIIKKRQGVDTTEVEITQAAASVEEARANLILAQQSVRNTSDNLKRLINSPQLPMSGETLIIPLDRPADLPVTFNVLDAVTTALQHRPELQSALLEIKDATIRQRVADNQRLPLLNLAATLRSNGVGDSLDEAYIVASDMNFIDYIVGLQFEVPLGNRSAEALLRQRQLEKRASVINYQRLSQQVVLEVKQALRDVITAYELIAVRRAQRLAAANNIRAINAQIEAGQALTSSFVDLKLRREQELARDEAQEAQALTDYHTAISLFYQRMGTLMERNGIEFEDPAARDGHH